MIPTKPRKVIRITLTPDDHLENMPSFNRPKSPILKSEELLKEEQAFKDAASAAVKQHHDQGRPVPTMRDGKLVWVDKDGNIVPEPPNNL